MHPRPFREELGDALEEMLAHRAVDAARRGAWGRMRFWLRETVGLAGSLLRERVRFASGRPGRAAHHPPVAHGIFREARHAARRLARSPMFTSAAVLTMALAIGANTAIYAVTRGILLSPLPYPDSERLVLLEHGARSLGLASGLGMTSGIYVHYRERTSHLGSLAIYQPQAMSVTGNGDPERANVLRATPSLSRVLRVSPRIGRWFSEEEGEVGAAVVAVLSHGFWQRRFGGDPDVVGRTITLNGIAREIVGVMPEGFEYPQQMRPDVWLPLQLSDATIRPVGFNYAGVARLSDGSTLEDFLAEQERVLAQLPERFPQDASAVSFITDAKPFAASRFLKDAMVGSLARTLWTLVGAAAMVLLIACANVANLFLVRSESRHRELAVRRALGAGRGVVPAMLLTEAGVLSLAGGAAGLGLAVLAVKVLVAYGPRDLPRLDEVGVDAAVAVFALGVSVLSAMLFGSFPLLRRGPALAPSLHESGRGNTASGVRMRARNVLVGAQVALSLMLLIASGLMAKSFQRLRDVDPGFAAASVLAFDVALPLASYGTGERAAAFHDQLLERIRALPGVQVASATTCAPLSGFCFGDPLEVEGVARREGEVPPIASMRRVADGYFDAMGVAAVDGRVFDATDHGTPARAVVVDERLAQLYFPGQNPIGKRISPEYMDPAPSWYEIVGVVPHVVTISLTAEERPPQLYFPMLSYTTEGTPSPHNVFFMVRTATPPLDLVPAVRAALAELDGSIPVGRITTLEDMLARDRGPMAFTMVLIVIAGATALALGLVGIYGVISYAVTQRTGEIGVRIALGARPGDVSAMILRQGGVVALVGLLVGLAGAAAASGVMEALLFGVSPTDLLTYMVVAAALFAVSLFACWLPARRAARLDPVAALRSE
jgi:predicted permease